MAFSEQNPEGIPFAQPFECDLQLLSWSTTPTGGHTIKLLIDEYIGREHPFSSERFGKSGGQRYRVHFTPIDD